MANVIKIKNSGTANSAPTSLEVGELAINYNDGKIFYKDTSNAVVEFTGPSGLIISNTAPAVTDILWADTSVTGVGVVPVGGTTGQMLAKSSSADYDAAWATPVTSSDLALKAPLASPALTGTPTSPTAAAGTNTTQIATMASRPWNMAWGHLGSSTLETSFATTNPHTTFQDEGLSTSVTYAANRKLRITLSVRPYTNGGTNFVAYRVLRGSTVVANWGFGYPDISNTEAPAKTVVFVMTTPGTGATETFKVQIQGISNTAVTSYGQSWTAADGGRQLIIEDIGPA